MRRGVGGSVRRDRPAWIRLWERDPAEPEGWTGEGAQGGAAWGAMEGPVSEGELDFNRQGAEASPRVSRVRTHVHMGHRVLGAA